MAENKMTLAELQDRITQAPFHQWLGLKVAEVTEDGIQITVPWRQEFLVNAEAGYAHGGILATLIDTASDMRWRQRSAGRCRPLISASTTTGPPRKARLPSRPG